jgi:spore germination protein GerM
MCPNAASHAFRVVLLALVAVLACVGVASAAGASPHVSVYFLRGEQLASVQRQGSSSLDAMRELLAGPTPAERAEGFRTYLPARTRLLNVNVAHGVATVDLNEPFASGSDSESLLARLSQVVRTLTGPEGATKVQLLVNGRVVTARFPGISLSP